MIKRINVSVDEKDWEWLQNHRLNQHYKASHLLRLAIRERMADEGGAWKTKADLKEQIENLQAEIKKLWAAIEESGAESAVSESYKKLSMPQTMEVSSH